MFEYYLEPTLIFKGVWNSKHGVYAQPCITD